MKWYLVFTKLNEEEKVVRQFTGANIENLFPKIKKQRMRMKRVIAVTEPLFPRYVFTRIDLEEKFRTIKYTRGVVGFVDFGLGPVAVDQAIVDDIRARDKNGYIDITHSHRRYRKNELLRVKRGLFKDMDVIFDGYLSGEERVSLLLNSINSNIRLNMHKYYL